MSVDGLGNPLRFTLTAGHKHDITQAEKLICGYAGEYVIADKGYDSHRFIEHISDSGMVAVIPLAPTVNSHAHTMTICTGNDTSSSVS